MGYPVRPLDMLALWRIFPDIRGYLLATGGSLTATRYSPAYVGGYPYEIDDDTPDFQNFPCIRGYPTDECSFSLNGILSPAYGGSDTSGGFRTRRIFPGMRGYPVLEGTRIFTKGCVIEGCV